MPDHIDVGAPDVPPEAREAFEEWYEAEEKIRDLQTKMNKLSKQRREAAKELMPILTKIEEMRVRHNDVVIYLHERTTKKPYTPPRKEMLERVIDYLGNVNKKIRRWVENMLEREFPEPDPEYRVTRSISLDPPPESPTYTQPPGMGREQKEGLVVGRRKGLEEGYNPLMEVGVLRGITKFLVNIVPRIRDFLSDWRSDLSELERMVAEL